MEQRVDCGVVHLVHVEDEQTVAPPRRVVRVVIVASRHRARVGHLLGEQRAERMQPLRVERVRHEARRRKDLRAVREGRRSVRAVRE